MFSGKDTCHLPLSGTDLAPSFFRSGCCGFTDSIGNNILVRNAENLSENNEERRSRIEEDTTGSCELFVAKFSNCSKNAYCLSSPSGRFPLPLLMI